jgi:pectin-derived oligosaccharide transport system permease protein
MTEATVQDTAAIAAELREALRKRQRRAGLMKHAFLILCSLVMVYPLIWMLMASLKPDNEIFNQSLSLWPSDFQWSN